MTSANILFVIAVLVPALTASGCAMYLPRSYASPEEVTIPEAMREVASGLSDLRQELQSHRERTGLIVDQVDVTLNVAASATGTSGLVVDAKAAQPIGIVSLGGQYTDTTQVIGSRANVVKLTLKNIYTAQLNMPGAKAAVVSGPSFDPGRGPIVPYRTPRKRSGREKAIETRKHMDIARLDCREEFVTSTPRNGPKLSHIQIQDICRDVSKVLVETEPFSIDSVPETMKK